MKHSIALPMVNCIVFGEELVVKTSRTVAVMASAEAIIALVEVGEAHLEEVEAADLAEVVVVVVIWDMKTLHHSMYSTHTHYTPITQCI